MSRALSPSKQKLGPLVLLCVLVALVGASDNPAGAFPVNSWYESRWEGVHRQETDLSCGPASVVTLLKTYFEVPVEEAEVFALATSYLAGDGAATALLSWSGTTLRGLRDAMEAFGFRSAGVGISVDGLLRYFDEVGLPVIAHMTSPERHFVVVVGKVGAGALLVADPSKGRYLLTPSDAEQRLSGNILLYQPPRRIREGVVVRHLNGAELQLRFLQRLVDFSGRRRL